MTDPARLDHTSADRRRQSDRRRSVVALVLIVLAVFLSRVPMALTALRGSELASDEADLTEMAVDHFFGTPLTNTHWPAITNQVLLMPLVVGDYLASGQPHTPDGFAHFAGAVYRDPAHLVLIHRLLIVALNALATAAVCWSLRRHGVAMMTAAAMLLQDAHLVVYGTIGMGNGPAIAAMIGVLACALHDGRGRARAIGIGLLCGLALASRNTSVLLAPVVIAVMWELGTSARERLRFGGLALAGLIAGSAPAWTLAALDPIRWAKANLGNFVKTGAPAGPIAAMHVVLDAGGWLFWLAALAAAIWLLIRGRHRAIVIGWLLSLAFGVVTSARAPVVETRYFDAILIGAAFVCILAVREALAASSTADRPVRIRGGLLVACAAVAIAGVVSASLTFRASCTGLMPQARLVVSQLHAPADGGLLIVDHEMLPELSRRADATSFQHLADGIQSAMQNGAGLRDFTDRFHLDPSVSAVFAQDLNEKEQCRIMRARVAAVAPPTGEPLAFITAGDTNAVRRFGSIAIDDAVSRVRSGVASEAVLTAESMRGIDVTGVTPHPMGDGTYVSIRRD